MSELSGQKVIIDFIDRPRQVHTAMPTPDSVRAVDGFLVINVSDDETHLFPVHTIRSVEVQGEWK